MIWLTWRLQRTELVLLGLILLGLGGILVATHADVVATSTIYTAEICPVPLIGTEGGCFIELSQLYQLFNEALPWLNFLPLISALLLALPIVMELESGSYRLAWTQGITRGQWTGIKFGMLVTCGMVFAAVFALAFHWWSSPRDGLYGRLSQDYYDFRGIVPVGHALFAIGLMLAVGVLIRRPILALASASVVYVAVRIPFIQWIRPYLVDPITLSDADYHRSNMGHVSIVDDYWRDAAGNKIENSAFSDLCFPAEMNPTRALQEQCIAEHGLVHFLSFHPESHYWPLQSIETAIFIGAGLALIGFAAWWVLRRVE